MNTREVTLALPLHREGGPYVVRLIHRPSGKSVEGSAPTIDEAKAQAERLLEVALTEVHAQ